MPPHKRSRQTTTSPPHPLPPFDDEKDDDSLQGSENHNNEELDNASDSDGSSYSSDGEKDEFIVVKLAEIRKEVQCPICLGVIRKTRTVMECLHRFCRECIDKSMRLGNNECPACRTHCASRRSLRDDPNYDALIAALYPDIDKYEEEELAFREEEIARNKLIQDSITQTFRRQAEAVGKKRVSAKATAATLARRQGNNRNLRGRRNNRAVEHNGSDNGSKDSSSTDDQSAEVKSRRYKRQGGAQSSRPSSGANAHGGCDDNNDSEENRESISASAALGKTDFPSWGRGGMRNNNRRGGLSWANGRLSKESRLSKLINHLQQCSHENDESMLKMHLLLVSMDEEKIPNLHRPYIFCSRTLSIRHLCQYVAMQTSVIASDIEMLIVKDVTPVNNASLFKKESGSSNPHHNGLQLLNEHLTLEQIQTTFIQRNLVLAYRPKTQREGN